ncbi:MAG: hypothetical protein JJE25_06735, partial [Bacteroidia bacterium]|nr:hypothetical protein [Bacteroidia bacterium]
MTVYLMLLVAVMLTANIQNSRAGCPRIEIHGNCAPSQTLTFTGTATFDICPGEELTFTLIPVILGCHTLSVDATNGYSGCSFPGTLPAPNVSVDGPLQWSCVFSAIGTYVYILCTHQILGGPNPCLGSCEGHCITLTVNVTEPTLEITGPRNNCIDPNGFTVYYPTVPTGWWIDNVVINGMDIPNGYTWGHDLSWFWTIQVDYTGSSFLDASNNYSAGELCVTYNSTCCGEKTVCIPIYKCCECDPLLTTLFINDKTANWVLNDQSFFNVVNGSTVSTYLTGEQIVINGEFIIDDDITFEDCQQICMGPEARIFIKKGKTLTLSSPNSNTSVYARPEHNILNPENGTILQHGCGIMWDGIYFEDYDSKLIVNPSSNNYTFLEGARNAVVSDNEAEYRVRWGGFRNNNKDIIVNSTAGAHPGSIIHSELFTLALLPMLPFYTPNTITLNNPLARTNIGIELNNVNGITIGVATAPTDQNYFHNIDLGIVSNNSVLHSTNNRFNNFHRLSPCAGGFPPPPCPIEVGCIVARVPASATSIAAIKVGGSAADENVFTDSDNGIYVEGIHSVDIGYNTFTDIGLNSLSPWRNGVYVTRSTGSVMDVYNNTFNHFQTGISFVYNPFSNVNINDNIFNNTYTSPIPSRCTAINAQEPYVIWPFYSLFHILDNTISWVQTGVMATNLFGADIKSFSSFQDIVFDVTHPTSYVSYGIRMQNNERSMIQQNVIFRCTANISMNTPPPSTCFAGPAYIDKLFGISVESSKSTTVFDNILAHLGGGIRCFNIAAPNTFTCNKMGYCQRGFTLDNSNPGTQGNQAQAQDNQWRRNAAFNSNNPGALDVYGLASAANQIWWIRSNSPLLPYTPQQMFPTGILDITNNNAVDNNNCTYLASIANGLDGLQSELAGAVRYTREENCPLNEQGKFLSQLNVYMELMYNDSLLNLGTTDDSYLQAFYDSATNTDIGALAHVRLYIGEKDTSSAAAANSTVTEVNQAAYNEKTTNQIYL